MIATILSVGDELVLGQTLDTNGQWLAARLAAIGIHIARHVTVGDLQADIERAVRDAADGSDVILISGGIGPTEDDVTRQAVAAVLGVPLESDSRWIAHLDEWFAKLRRPMPPINAVQAMIPRGATLIWNHAGTAAGVAAMVGRARLWSMPGVPREMKAMFDADVLPALRQASGGAAIVQRILHTFGVGESTIGERLGELMRRGRNPSVGTTVSGGIVSIRVNATAASEAEAIRLTDEACAAIHAALGDLIFGEGSDTLPRVIQSMLTAAADAGRGHTIATAESCTGGLIAKMLTDTAGSSAHVLQGWVTYTNESKTAQLGVPADVIAEHGAVSEPVAAAMARGARERSQSDFAIGVTGIAGPGGATPTKPVGTVCIGLAHPDGVDVRTFILPGERDMVRDRSAKMALTLLRFRLMGRPLPF